MTVGYFMNPRTPPIGFALTLSWDGQTWSDEAIAHPTGALSDTLEGVSCASSTSCMAVGYSVDKAENNRALVEQWDGVSWSIVPLPQPPGPALTEFLAVSCVSSTACMAVGSAGRESVSGFWDGATWAIQPIPRPAGAMSSATAAVSCVSARVCAAVGATAYARSSSPGYMKRTLAARWNGTRWSIQPTPNFKGATFNDLDDVSCPSSSACTAVGSFAFSKGTVIPLREVLVARWNGERWSAEPAPNPQDTDYSELVGVSCASNTLCTAVGDWQLNSGVSQTLAEQWDGSSWQIQSTPNPEGPRISAFLQQVSCPTIELCTAAGSSFEGEDGRPLIERFTAPPASALITGVPASCVVAPFTALIRGHRISSVRWSLNGTRVQGRTVRPGTRYVAAITLAPGRHQLIATVTFNASSHATPRTFRKTVSGCLAPPPTVTG